MTKSVPSPAVSIDAVEVGGIGDLRNNKLFKKFSMRVSGAFGTDCTWLMLGIFESGSGGELFAEEALDCAFNAIVGDDPLKVFWLTEGMV